MSENPRLIDGILLTKFDTIDDKVSGLAWFPNDLVPVFQTLDSAIHQINHYHICWSPEGARWARLVPSGFPALVPQKVFVGDITNLLLTKLVRSRGLYIGLVLFHVCRVIKNAKKNLGQYTAILTEQTWSITYTVNPLLSPPFQLIPLPVITPPPPLFRGREVISPPSLLGPLPYPPPNYSSPINERLLINHDRKTSCGVIQDGLFTNWKFGFHSDPRGGGGFKEVVYGIVRSTSERGFLWLLGWRRYLHDIHHWPANCVCGHRTNVQRPKKP